MFMKLFQLWGDASNTPADAAAPTPAPADAAAPTPTSTYATMQLVPRIPDWPEQQIKDAFGKNADDWRRNDHELVFYIMTGACFPMTKAHMDALSLASIRRARGTDEIERRTGFIDAMKVISLSSSAYVEYDKGSRQIRDKGQTTYTFTAGCSDSQRIALAEIAVKQKDNICMSLWETRRYDRTTGCYIDFPAVCAEFGNVVRNIAENYGLADRVKIAYVCGADHASGLGLHTGGPQGGMDYVIVHNRMVNGTTSAMVSTHSCAFISTGRAVECSSTAVRDLVHTPMSDMTAEERNRCRQSLRTYLFDQQIDYIETNGVCFGNSTNQKKRDDLVRDSRKYVK